MASPQPDLTTPVGQLRFLIGDSVYPYTLDDLTLQMFLDINNESLYLAAATALDSLAAMAITNFESVKIGDYQNSDKDKVAALQLAATRYRDLEYNTPAWAVVEENLSGFNELTIIRNWVLRTEM